MDDVDEIPSDLRQEQLNKSHSAEVLEFLQNEAFKGILKYFCSKVSKLQKLLEN